LEADTKGVEREKNIGEKKQAEGYRTDKNRGRKKKTKGGDTQKKIEGGFC